MIVVHFPNTRNLLKLVNNKAAKWNLLKENVYLWCYLLKFAWLFIENNEFYMLTSSATLTLLFSLTFYRYYNNCYLCLWPPARFLNSGASTMSVQLQEGKEGAHEQWVTELMYNESGSYGNDKQELFYALTQNDMWSIRWRDVDSEVKLSGRLYCTNL